MDRLYTLKEAKMLLRCLHKRPFSGGKREEKIRVVRTPGVGGLFLKERNTANTGGRKKRGESYGIRLGLVPVAEGRFGTSSGTNQKQRSGRSANRRRVGTKMRRGNVQFING